MSTWVAMSGGVDSSVAAALLLEQGQDVVGVTLSLLGAESVPVINAAAEVCDSLEIRHVVMDAVSEFEELVTDPYVDAYVSGATPNPCVRCNTHIKFGWLLERVLEQGADGLATGHYARLVPRNDDTLALLKALDRDKDQSYFLYGLNQTTRHAVSFPLGELTKAEVRQRATDLGLAVAEEPESQEACFTARTGHIDYVCAHRPEAAIAGPIVDRSGNVLGSHRGIARYTVGQRKGLGIGGPGPSLFVLEIDASANTVVVGAEAELEVSLIEAQGEFSESWDGERVEALYRYRMDPRPAIVREESTGMSIVFDSPVRGVAPGQSVVCYVGDEVVAGGEITCAR